VGSGIVSQGVVMNHAALTGHEYLLKFCAEEVNGKAETRYDVIDLSTNTTLSKGNKFGSGEVIEFDGVQFEIKGEPGDLDEFYVHPSENESLFKTLADLIEALRVDNELGGSTAKAQFTNSVNRALNNLDRGLDNVSTVRTSLGSRLREIDALQVTGEDVGLQYKNKLSELQDADLNKSISDLNQQQSSLTAAQKSFKQASDLTLFNYL
jgi:flagellar hook-associated protein 3 FlgL